MAPFLFRAPNRLLTGAGAIQHIGVEAARLAARHALIVTSSQVIDAGHVALLRASLDARGVASSVYSGVDTEPTTEHVERGHAAYVAAAADAVVAIGGGSCLDVGKGVAIRTRNEGPLAQYEGADRIHDGRCPLIAISTTAGTGSEVTRFGVFTDTARDVKMLLTSDAFLPDVAIDDPKLTLSCPPLVTAAAGIDALTHAIEAFVSKHAQPLSDTLALSSIRLISRSLAAAHGRGADLEARSAMLDASLRAGLAFSNSSVALVHGMARPLGALFHIPHGVANGILLPHVMAYSLPAATQRYAAIAEALGQDRSHGDEAAAYQSVDVVRMLCTRLGLGSLRSFGITREQLDTASEKMAHDALASGSPSNNPRIATVDDIKAIYAQAL